MQPIARYLHRLHEIHASGQGTAETSSYSPLEELLEAIGRCGAGAADSAGNGRSSFIPFIAVQPALNEGLGASSAIG